MSPVSKVKAEISFDRLIGKLCGWLFDSENNIILETCNWCSIRKLCLKHVIYFVVLTLGYFCYHMIFSYLCIKLSFVPQGLHFSYSVIVRCKTV